MSSKDSQVAGKVMRNEKQKHVGTKLQLYREWYLWEEERLRGQDEVHLKDEHGYGNGERMNGRSTD